MDPVTASELAIALHSGTAPQWSALAGAVRATGPDPADPVLEPLLGGGRNASPHGRADPAALARLATALLERARRDQGFAAGLCAWTARVLAPAPGGGAANTIGGAARVTGPSLQARDVSGGVHFHPAVPAAAPPVPRQLLPVPATFIGREEDTARLDGLRGARLVVVSGPAGVGKTTFVSHWLHRTRDRYPDGQLYADLRGHGPNGPAGATEVLGRFLRAYGITVLPVDPSEQAALWRSVAIDLRIAVMLDNAVSAAQVRPLLPGGPDGLVVVASRRRMTGLTVDGAAFHDLGPLAPEAAVELLTSRIGPGRVEREREAARRVVALCGRLPLAVCLAGARMAARPSRTVTAMADVLGRDPDRLAELRSEGRWQVRAALDESYAALPAEVARGYRCLAAQPVAVLRADVVAAACGVPRRQAEELLEELIEANLIEECGADRFRFHDLVRLHAAQCAERDPEALRRATVRRVADWYLAAATAAEALLTPSHRTLERTYRHPPAEPPAFAGPAEALEWLAQEQEPLADLVVAAGAYGWDDTVWQLVDACWPLFHRFRPYRWWVEAHETGLAAARRAGDPRAVSRMLTTGGGGLLNAGRFDDALEAFGQAVRDAVRDGDRRARAQALHGTGQAHQLAGRLGAAHRAFDEALRLREEIGYRRGAALSRCSLGEVALAAGRPQEAVGLLTAARGELLAVPDPHDAARARALLGRARAGAGDLLAGERELLGALAEFESVGSGPWRARTLEMLGQTASERGDAGAARQWYERALSGYLTVSPRDTARLRERINSLGDPPGAG